MAAYAEDLHPRGWHGRWIKKLVQHKQGKVGRVVEELDHFKGKPGRFLRVETEGDHRRIWAADRVKELEEPGVPEGFMHETMGRARRNVGISPWMRELVPDAQRARRVGYDPNTREHHYIIHDEANNQIRVGRKIGGHGRLIDGGGSAQGEVVEVAVQGGARVRVGDKVQRRGGDVLEVKGFHKVGGRHLLDLDNGAYGDPNSYQKIGADQHAQMSDSFDQLDAANVASDFRNRIRADIPNAKGYIRLNSQEAGHPRYAIWADGRVHNVEVIRARGDLVVRHLGEHTAPSVSVPKDYNGEEIKPGDWVARRGLAPHRVEVAGVGALLLDNGQSVNPGVYIKVPKPKTPQSVARTPHVPAAEEGAQAMRRQLLEDGTPTINPPDWLQNGEVGSLVNHSHGTSGCYFGKLKAGKETREVVVKPDSEGSQRVRHGHQVPDGTCGIREVACFEIAQRFGVRIPRVIHRETVPTMEGDQTVPNGPGTIAERLPGYKNYAAAGNPALDSADVMRMAVFDSVVGNVDRHTGNLGVTPDGKLWSIDHGLSFSEQVDWANAAAVNTMQGHRIPPDLAQALVKMTLQRQTIDARLKELGISDRAINLMWGRVGLLLSTGKIPRPSKLFGDSRDWKLRLK